MLSQDRYSLEQWKQLMTDANQEFSARTYATALVLYQQALEQLLKTFSEQVEQDARGAVAAVMVNYFNLADTFLAVKQPDQSCEQFEQAFLFLQALINSGSTTDELKDIALHACGRLEMEWACCIQQHSRGLVDEHKLRYRNVTLALQQDLVCGPVLH